MSGSLINIIDSKLFPSSIGDELLSIRFPFAKTSKGVPELMTITCRYIQVQYFEDVAVSEVRSISRVGVGLVWRDLVRL